MDLLSLTSGVAARLAFEKKAYNLGSYFNPKFAGFIDCKKRELKSWLFRSSAKDQSIERVC
jgi:hypothetical protein